MRPLLICAGLQGQGHMIMSPEALWRSQDHAAGISVDYKKNGTDKTYSYVFVLPVKVEVALIAGIGHQGRASQGRGRTGHQYEAPRV